MRLADLQPASFRGVSFLVPQDDATEGPHVVEHKYPDSSHRYLEPNGYQPPDFKVRAIIHGDGLPGKLNALRSALNRQAPGTLKHPVYGSKRVMVKGPYTIQRQDRQSGVIELDITFGVTNKSGFPFIPFGIAALVTTLVSGLTTTLFAGFAAEWISPSSTQSQTVAEANVSRLAVTMESALGQSATNAAYIADNVARLVREPTTLAARFELAFREPFEDDALTADQIIAAFIAMQDDLAVTRAERALIPATTLDYVNRRANLDLIDGVVSAAVFGALAEAMAGKTYATADDVARDEERLATAFQAAQSSVLSTDMARTVAEVYEQASAVLDDQAVKLPNLATLTVYEMPASVLAYQLYDSTSNRAALIANNLDQNPLLFDGPTQILRGDAA